MISSSSCATCLKRRWNFFCRLLLNDLRFFPVEAPSVDLFAIDLTEDEYRLVVDKFAGTFALGRRCSWVAFVDDVDDDAAKLASDLSTVDDVIICGTGTEFDTFEFVDVFGCGCSLLSFAKKKRKYSSLSLYYSFSICTSQVIVQCNTTIHEIVNVKN